MMPQSSMPVAHAEHRVPDALRPSWRQRLPAALLTLGAWSILALAAWMPTSATGVGTHTSLGLPPCGLLTFTGIPCATCGYTTAFSAAAHGRLLEAFQVQPAAACLILLVAATAIIAPYSLATGMPLAPFGAALFRPRVFVIAAAVVLLAWVYKIILMHGAAP